jgi:ABC-type Na+ efflux pump permease subunit
MNKKALFSTAQRPITKSARTHKQQQSGTQRKASTTQQIENNVSNDSATQFDSIQLHPFLLMMMMMMMLMMMMIMMMMMMMILIRERE